MKNDSDQIEDLQQRVLILREAVELLMGGCSCSVPERMSGHLVDCPTPHVEDLLNSFDEVRWR